MTEIIFADDTPQEIRDEVLRLEKLWTLKPKHKLARGYGINDADYMTQCMTIYGQWKCPFYIRWYSMLTRVYSKSFHKSWKTYIGSEVHPEWLSFMNFRSWCLNNGWRSDYQLDKDFISDSKMYGPDTCAFIPPKVNTFIINGGIERDNYPEETNRAWKQKKHKHALALADMYPDLDPRVLDVLRNKYKPS